MRNPVLVQLGFVAIFVFTSACSRSIEERPAILAGPIVPIKLAKEGAKAKGKKEWKPSADKTSKKASKKSGKMAAKKSKATSKKVASAGKKAKRGLASEPKKGKKAKAKKHGYIREKRHSRHASRAASTRSQGGVGTAPEIASE